MGSLLVHACQALLQCTEALAYHLMQLSLMYTALVCIPCSIRMMHSSDMLCREVFHFQHQCFHHSLADVLQNHPFFTGIDWDSLYSTQAPHMPTVKHPLDTQNFENFDEQAPVGLNPGGMKRWARADPNFVGYTYKNWEAVQPGAHDGDFSSCLLDAAAW